jgi:hypothetical protein
VKMQCEILGIETTGLNLRLKLQGRQKNCAEWREWCSMTIEIPATEKTKPAFYLGRRVIVDIRTE